MEIIVNLEKLVQYKVGLEAYFVLYCLNENKEKELITYAQNCRKIPTSTFEELEKQGYIVINTALMTDNKITYNVLKLTSLGKEIFTVRNIDVIFEEFRTFYPKKTPDGRTLHLDLKRCKSLYKKIIGNNEQMHETLCGCAKAYHEEKRRSSSESYMQNLASWLHQENYKQYIEEKMVEEGGHSEDI